MKKTFKISGIIALAAAIGFFMTACPDDKGSPAAKPEKFITVTSIPSEHNGKIGAVKLSPPASSNITAYSTEEKISENSVTLPLFKWAGEEPWSGSGNYSITIFIFENRTAAAKGQSIYAGKTDNTITETTTVIEWSLFIPK